MSKLRQLQPTKIFQLTALTLALSLVGCGGGSVDSIALVPDGSTTTDTSNGGGTGSGNGSDGGEDVKNTANYKVQTISPPSLIEMRQGSTATVKVRVVDENFGVVPEQAVTFSITDPELTGVVNSSASSVVSNEDGEASIVLEIPSKLTDQQAAYLKDTGLTVEASIGKNVKSFVIKGTEEQVQIDTDYIVHLVSSSPTMKTGSDSATLVFRVLNAKGGIETDAPVTFELQPDPEAVQDYGVSFGSASSAKSDENGQVSIGLVQSKTGIDAQLEHNVDVILKINDVQENKVTVKVKGTNVKAVTNSLSSSNTGANDLTTVRGILVDGSGISIANANVELHNDDTVVASGKTNDEGEFLFEDVALTNLKTSMNANGKPAYKFDLLVRGSKLNQLINEITSVNKVTDDSISINDACEEVVVGKSCDISVIAPSSYDGKAVRIVTTKGEFTNGSNTQTATFSGGQASFTLMSNSPGPATISAEAISNGETTNRRINFLSIDPARLILQATKVEIAPNNTTGVSARVLDKDDAPVKNAWVQFTVVKDSSGGNLESGLVKTDEDGVAKTIYVAGGNPTPSGGVEVRAQVHSVELPDGSTVDNSLVEDVVPVTVNLTVQTNASTISSGLADKLSVDSSNVYYFREGSIAVTNNGGQPAANQVVTMKLLPLTYYKGYWKYDYRTFTVSGIRYITEKREWHIPEPYSLSDPHTVDNSKYICANEDTNYNSILDEGEDTNGDGKLWPGFRATVLVDGQVISGNNGTYTLTTDATGRVDFQIRYFKQDAQWMTMKMVVSTSVDGTEASHESFVGFPVLADDVKTGNSAIRPNTVSPFGTSTCVP